MTNFDTTLFKNGHLAIVRMDLALSIVGTKTTMRPKYFSKLFLHAFLNPNIFSNLNSNCSNLLDMRNLQEQVKKAFCYQKLF